MKTWVGKLATFTYFERTKANSIVIHCLKQYEIMNKDQQQLYRDISNLTKAIQKLVKLIEKMAKQQL